MSARTRAMALGGDSFLTLPTRSLLVRYPGDCPLYILLGVLEVDELAGQVLFVGAQVEVSVAAEVEEDHLPLEGLVLDVGARLDKVLMHERRDYGRVAVVAQAPGVDTCWHERVSQSVHLHQRRSPCGVAEVVCVAALRKRGTRGRLDGEDARVSAVPQVPPDEGEGDPGEVRPAADAPYDHVGVLAGHLHLL